MADTSWAKKNGFTPGKTAFIAVLSIIFVWVVYSQIFPAKPTSRRRSDRERVATRPTSARRPARRTSVTTPPPATDQELAVKEAVQWPSFTLEEITNHDPFALPDALRQPEAPAAADAKQTAETGDEEGARVVEEQIAKYEAEQKREALRTTLQQQGTRMIVTGKNGNKAALIGDRLVRVGDLIDGFRVKDIRSDGVILVSEDQ